MKEKNLLEVKDLRVSFFTPVGEVKAVDGISYSLGYNEVMGIVGESGSGKSVRPIQLLACCSRREGLSGVASTLRAKTSLLMTRSRCRLSEAMRCP